MPLQIFLVCFSREVNDRPLAAVIKGKTDWSQVRLLLECCLRKDPTQGVRDIGDARIALEVLSGATSQRWRRIQQYRAALEAGRFIGTLVSGIGIPVATGPDGLLCRYGSR